MFLSRTAGAPGKVLVPEDGDEDGEHAFGTALGLCTGFAKP